MYLSILNFIACATAAVAPIVILTLGRRSLMRRGAPSGARRVLMAVFALVSWAVGIIAVTVGHHLHESAWLHQHPDGPVSEEDMAAIGDYPNVLTGWILLGWLPIVLGFVAAQRWSKRQLPNGPR